MTESPNPLPSLLPVPTDWCTPVTGAGPGSDMLSVALALGGLGGFNNHVGGVLSASLEGDVHPALISCTSGAVAWTAAYLQAIHAGLPKDQQIAKLRAAAQQSATRTTILPRDFRVANDALIGLFGLPGLARPMWPNYFLNLFWPPSLKALTQRPSEIAWTNDLADRLLPAGWAESTRSATDFAEIADALTQTQAAPPKQVGVVFNAYDPNRCEEILFLNRAAAAWLDPARTRVGTDGSSPRQKYRAINDTAVRAALRLFAYGFDWKVWDPVEQIERTLVDGAYYRQVILSELHGFDLILSARPLNEKYKSDLPSNSLGSLNLQTEALFNGSYQGQRDAIELINTLTRANPAAPPALHGHPTRLVTVEAVDIMTSYGFFDYFVETLDTFDQGVQQTRQAIARQRRLGKMTAYTAEP